MTFNSGHVVAIGFYTVLMIVSAVGNITVLVILLRRRNKGRSRINNMLMHLSIADLLVTFLMMPLEIAWNYTVDWRGGDVLCRIMSFNRIFGLYLSSYVLVCISVDRYFAVLRPMQISDRRGRWMLVGAWVAAFVCSVPQMVVFKAMPHPDHPWYVQCITKGTLTDPYAEVAYAAFGMVATYCVPLSVIIFSYASILVEIFRRSRDPIDDKLRRSSLGFLGRAKIRTLKMTIIIVLVFFVCSTPYYVMMVWYWVDPEAHQTVDPRVQKGLLLFCSANSCMNPIVYGAFNIRTRRSTSQRPRQNKSARQRALGLLRYVSWRRREERDERDDAGGGAEAVAAASAASSSEHGAHGAHHGHRGSRGSQGSEVSCITEWSEVHSTCCLKQGVDPPFGAVGDHGPQADAEKRAALIQGEGPKGGRRGPGQDSQGLGLGSVASVLQEPGVGGPVHGTQPGSRFTQRGLPENHRFRLSQRSVSAPGIPLGGPPGVGAAGSPSGCYGGRMFELRREPSGGKGVSFAACPRRDGGGRGQRAGRAGGAAGTVGTAGAAEVTSSM